MPGLLYLTLSQITADFSLDGNTVAGAAAIAEILGAPTGGAQAPPQAGAGRPASASPPAAPASTGGYLAEHLPVSRPQVVDGDDLFSPDADGVAVPGAWLTGEPLAVFPMSPG